MPRNTIFVKGAREHNLKNIDVSIPRDKFVVITGISGSGKSSLAFDTIYAEGQRRYVESLSAYARQFLGRMEKPDVDYIEGLSPAISIDQKGARHNPRSTVGTVTEIYDYVRLLYARAGRPHCPNCGRLISRQTIQQIVDSIQAIPPATRIMIMSPMVASRKGEHQSIFDDARKAGFVRVRVNGEIRDLSEQFSLDKKKKHTIEVVVDRLVVGESEGEASRLADSVETALKLADGVVLISIVDGVETLYSEHFACVQCGISLGEIEPRTFSFNSPHGACAKCTGLGARMEVDPDFVLPNKSLSLTEGALQPWARSGAMSSWYSSMIESVAHAYGFSTRVPVRELKEEHIGVVLYGTKRNPMTMSHTDKQGKVWKWKTSFEGVIPNLERRFSDTESDWVRREIERYMTSRPCPDCEGNRLKPTSLAVTVGGINIMAFTGKSIGEALDWVTALQNADHSVNGVKEPLTQRELTIAEQILKEIHSRLVFLRDIGLDYITLDRSAGTLSGGEAQRIRLATQIGSSLMGVLYVCDEPSVGLHPADDHRLIGTLKRLRDVGNTILIVEHDEAIMRAADHIIDLGPGAGEHGGWIVAEGTLDQIIATEASLTGQYLGGFRKIPVPSSRRSSDGRSLIIKGARENNLKNIDVEFPLGILVCVTGVSGSGKSTLINEILYKKLAQRFYKAKDRPGQCDEILGIEHIDKIVNIDQSPIGRTPRSNPATYTGAFTPIRELFATMPEARARGYKPGRFSFNVKGGRCEACQGEGYNQIEMQFLPDVTVPCDVCQGSRYGREALEIEFKGYTIAQILDMTVEQACGVFEHFPRISAKLNTMRDVGLGYIKIGQPATTLSGGEAQRVKLSTELSRRATGRTVYILDEPTTGLSFEDAAALLKVLQRLVDTGNTVILIEHHLDLIKSADYLIDLGPKAGDEGGYIVAVGTPEEIAAVPESYTGQYLSPILLKRQPEPIAAS